MNGVTIFIYGTVDLDEKVLAVIGISFGRSGLEAKAFFKKVRDTCVGRLPRIFIDGGTWYPWAQGHRFPEVYSHIFWIQKRY